MDARFPKNKIPEIIQAIGSRLYQEYGAETIILFGSYASRTARKDSDIDLLIIKKTEERPIERQTRVRRLIRDIRKGIPFSPIVLTPAEIEYRLRIGDQFLQQIFKSGIVLQ